MARARCSALLRLGLGDGECGCVQAWRRHGGWGTLPASGATEASDSTENKKLNKLLNLTTKQKKKICCACPDTKKLRDECIVQHGEDACGKWIEAHRQCLRPEGFNV
uniref:Cytochrome c oxidase copper chaperone n=1 Tax=Oryza brachyantha TaxID=4533 RepID=J3MXI5_ORYBR